MTREAEVRAHACAERSHMNVCAMQVHEKTKKLRTEGTVVVHPTRGTGRVVKKSAKDPRRLSNPYKIEVWP